MKIMTFYLDEASYAVELSAVAAVARAGAGGGRGAASAAQEVDGESAAFDLGAALGGGARAGEGPVLLLQGDDGREVAVRVDRLGEVAEVVAEGVREVPKYFASPLLRGVVEVGEGWAVLLDARAVLRAAAGGGEEGA